MHIKITVRYHLTLARMAIIRKFTNNKCWRGCGGKGTFLYSWWKCKLVQLLRKTVQSFLKKKNKKTKKWSCHMTRNSTPGHVPRQNYNSKRYMHPSGLCTTWVLFTIANHVNSQDMIQRNNRWMHKSPSTGDG